MKSNKQRRQEIKTKRLAKTAKKEGITRTIQRPRRSILADPVQLRHNNSYTPLPHFYVDMPFVCKDCGIHSVWTAQQQKWWYEVAKGDINSTAVRCRACRYKERQRRRWARLQSLTGLWRKAKRKLDENEVEKLHKQLLSVREMISHLFQRLR